MIDKISNQDPLGHNNLVSKGATNPIEYLWIKIIIMLIIATTSATIPIIVNLLSPDKSLANIRGAIIKNIKTVLKALLLKSPAPDVI